MAGWLYYPNLLWLHSYNVYLYYQGPLSALIDIFLGLIYLFFPMLDQETASGLQVEDLGEELSWLIYSVE